MEEVVPTITMAIPSPSRGHSLTPSGEGLRRLPGAPSRRGRKLTARIPHELWAALDEFQKAHGLSRYLAVRLLLFKALQAEGFIAPALSQLPEFRLLLGLGELDPEDGYKPDGKEASRSR